MNEVSGGRRARAAPQGRKKVRKTGLFNDWNDVFPAHAKT